MIIPARLGSKRLPRKNILQLEGEPILGHTIRMLRETQLFSHVFVSTESPEVRDVAEQYGAEVPHLRPSSLADDHTSTLSVIQHFLLAQEQIASHTPIFCVYPFAVLLKSFLLERTLDSFCSTFDTDDLFFVSVSVYTHPIERALRSTPSGLLEPVDSRAISMRTQDLTQSYHDAGQFYLASKQVWLNSQSIFTKAKGILIEHRMTVDLDTPEDWDRLALAWRTQNSQ